MTRKQKNSRAGKVRRVKTLPAKDSAAPNDVVAAAVTRLLTEREVAILLNVSPLTLRKWRCVKTHNLPFFKDGKAIGYRDRDVQQFIDSHIVTPVSLEQDAMQA